MEEGASRSPSEGKTRYMLAQNDRRGTTTVIEGIRFTLEWNMYDTLSEGKNE